MSDGSRLIQGKKPGDAPWSLMGRPVKPGDKLELRLVGRFWVPVVFGPECFDGDLPECHVVLGGSWEDPDVHTAFSYESRYDSFPRLYFRLHEDCILRWADESDATKAE